VGKRNRTAHLLNGWRTGNVGSEKREAGSSRQVLDDLQESVGLSAGLAELPEVAEHEINDERFVFSRPQALDLSYDTA
jgi:hypothetical protein